MLLDREIIFFILRMWIALTIWYTLVGTIAKATFLHDKRPVPTIIVKNVQWYGPTTLVTATATAMLMVCMERLGFPH